MTSLPVPKDSLPLLAATAARSILFDIFFVAWGLLGSAAVYIVVFLFGYKELLVKGCVLWCRTLNWGIENILNLHSRKDGWRHLPQGPFILAARHQSAWEAILMPIWFPHAAIVLKEQLLRVPFWGKCMEMFGAIPVERSRKGGDLRRMMAAAEQYKAEGRAIIIFPQGTRTKPGVKRPLQRGVAVLYEHLGIPVVPMNLNSGHFWGRKSFLKFPGTIDVTLHPPIPPGLPREELMARLEALFSEETGPK